MQSQRPQAKVGESLLMGANIPFVLLMNCLMTYETQRSIDTIVHQVKTGRLRICARLPQKAIFGNLRCPATPARIP